MMPVALLMLLAGAAAMGWPLLSGGEGRSDVKRRLKIDAEIAPATSSRAAAPKNANPVREKAVRTAQEFYAKSDPENVARLRMKLIQAGYMDPAPSGRSSLSVSEASWHLPLPPFWPTGGAAATPPPRRAGPLSSWPAAPAISRPGWC